MDGDAGGSTAYFGALFTCSQCGQDGTLGCMDKGRSCNADCSTYFSFTPTSMTMTGGSDCRTVSTDGTCNFTVGDNGITQISFDFEVTDACHTGPNTEWLSFWIYRNPWSNQVEVDFIESEYGPISGGLNSNFAGYSGAHQAGIFDKGTLGWSGSITADFSGTGNAVAVRVSNSVNPNDAGTSTLAADSGYFFVLDTAGNDGGSSVPGCSVTISNVKAQGTIPSGCTGLTASE